MMNYLTTSSQIVEQIEVVKEIGLPEISKLNDSVENKNQGVQTVSSGKKDSRKTKMDLVLPLIFTILSAITLIVGWFYKQIDTK